MDLTWTLPLCFIAIIIVIIISLLLLPLLFLTHDPSKVIYFKKTIKIHFVHLEFLLFFLWYVASRIWYSWNTCRSTNKLSTGLPKLLQFLVNTNIFYAIIPIKIIQLNIPLPFITVMMMINILIIMVLIMIIIKAMMIIW